MSTPEITPLIPPSVVYHAFGLVYTVTLFRQDWGQVGFSLYVLVTAVAWAVGVRGRPIEAQYSVEDVTDAQLLADIAAVSGAVLAVVARHVFRLHTLMKENGLVRRNVRSTVILNAQLTATVALLGIWHVFPEAFPPEGALIQLVLVVLSFALFYYLIGLQFTRRYGAVEAALRNFCISSCAVYVFFTLAVYVALKTGAHYRDLFWLIFGVSCALALLGLVYIAVRARRDGDHVLYECCLACATACAPEGVRSRVGDADSDAETLTYSARQRGRAPPPPGVPLAEQALAERPLAYNPYDPDSRESDPGRLELDLSSDDLADPMRDDGLDSLAAALNEVMGDRGRDARDTFEPADATVDAERHAARGVPKGRVYRVTGGE